MHTNQHNKEARYACVNWDSEVPMRVKHNGQKRPTARKVVTKGVCRSFMPELNIQDWIDALRAGNEVRICDGLNEPQIRLFPIVLKDMKTVVVSAQVMKDSALRKCLNDKKVKLVRDKDDEIKTINDAKKVSDEQYRFINSLVCVTPDKVVKCPKCGTKFRIGKYLNDAK